MTGCLILVWLAAIAAIWAFVHVGTRDDPG
jgi:hypothetical protein